jgi:hypothetical protein
MMMMLRACTKLTRKMMTSGKHQIPSALTGHKSAC